MSAALGTAAEQLLGIVLPEGWTVVERLRQTASATGGNFSVGYIVTDEEGRRGFLKAIDFARLLKSAGDQVDAPRALQAITEVYNFERDILQMCRTLRLSRVAAAISDGSVEVSGFEPLHQVYYLIFELAERDSRAHLDGAAALELVWSLRTLHHVATGLRQLHYNGIVHQDLKPSNVLEYADVGSRIADLGRAAQKGRVGPHDELHVAGDIGYAPPELLYGFIPQDWGIRRLGCDAYLLGSLAFFFLSRASMTAAVTTRLHPGHSHHSWAGSYSEILPFLRQAFDDVVQQFEVFLRPGIPERIAADLVVIVRELCEPDPRLRGHRRFSGSANTQFSMDRYATKGLSDNY